MKRHNTLLTISVIIIVITGIFLTQNSLTSMKGEEWNKERFSYLPESSRLKSFLMGYHTTFANYLWIRTMLYFGSQYQTSQDYTWLVEMVNMVTELNPRFYPAYEFAGIMLPKFAGAPGPARIILQRGLLNAADMSYNIPFYMGWIYHNVYNDYEQAADYTAMAAAHPEAPPLYAKFAATLYSKSGKRKTSISYLKSMYNTSQNPLVKKAVQEKLDEILKEEPQEASLPESPGPDERPRNLQDPGSLGQSNKIE